MKQNWIPIGFKKTAHETATLENFLYLLEARYNSLVDKIDNMSAYNLHERDCFHLMREIEVLEAVMLMGYEIAHRGYDTIIKTNYARGN